MAGREGDVSRARDTGRDAWDVMAEGLHAWDLDMLQDFLPRSQNGTGWQACMGGSVTMQGPHTYSVCAA